MTRIMISKIANASGLFLTFEGAVMLKHVLKACLDKFEEYDGSLYFQKTERGTYFVLTESEKLEATVQEDGSVEWEMVQDDSAPSPASALADAAGVSKATVYNRAKQLGRLPTVNELKTRKCGRKRKY